MSINKFFNTNIKVKGLKEKYKKELGDFRSYREVLDFVPRSVWDVNSRTDEIKTVFEDDVEKHRAQRTKKGYAVSIEQEYSVFNPLLGINILKIWSNVGDRVIDPFAGRDRALIANFMERHYKGYEISPKTYKQLATKIKRWPHFDNEYDCKVTLEDGVLLLDDIHKGERYDFCYTCPPYWFKEKYESVSGQISDIKTLDEWKLIIFRSGLSLQAVLKPHKYVAIVIADIRHKGVLIPLHSHWIDGYQSAGLKLKDIVINKTNPITAAGINGYLRNRIMQKSHEYVLIFQKS
jgi:DNA modification methylase